MPVSAEDGRQIWAPAGFAQGLCVLSDYAEIQYQCTGTYNSRAESVMLGRSGIGLNWPLREVILSEKDRNAQSLSQWLARPESESFGYPKTAQLYTGQHA
jgi:dTDP-4-dehydrorhamnose 3,5-epimerase